MRNILIKNSFSGIALLILSTILVFVSVSIFNKKLGSEVYGIFATLTLIGNVNIFSNLGINSSLLIFISENGKCKESDHNIIVAFIIFFFIVTLITSVAIVFNYSVIVNILNIPVAYYSSVRFLYFMLVFSNALILFNLIASAVMDSMQKMYITNLFQFLYNIVYNLSIISSIILSNNLNYIGLVTFISSLLWVIALNITAFKKWGKIDFHGLQFTFKHLLLKQLSLGSKVYISGMVFFFYEPFTKILISHFFGVKEVGFWDIALKVRNQITGLINKAGLPLLPYISQLKESDKIRLIIHDLEQKIYFIILPIVLISFFCTEPFIRLWIGGENVKIISITAFFITATFLIFSSPMNPQYMYLMSKGHAGKTIIIQTVNVTSNILIILITYRFWGYYSFVVSSTCAIIISFGLMLYYQKKLFNSLIFDNIFQIVKLIIIFITTYLIIYFLNIFVIMTDVIKLIINPIFIILTTVFFYKLFKILSVADLERYLGKNTRFFFIAKKILT